MCDPVVHVRPHAQWMIRTSPCTTVCAIPASPPSLRAVFGHCALKHIKDTGGVKRAAHSICQEHFIRVAQTSRTRDRDTAVHPARFAYASLQIASQSCCARVPVPAASVSVPRATGRLNSGLAELAGPAITHRFRRRPEHAGISSPLKDDATYKPWRLIFRCRHRVGWIGRASGREVPVSFENIPGIGHA